MRAVLYGIGWVSLIGGSLGLTLLPRLASWPWAFLVAGGIFSAFIGGGWLLGRATAEEWPRPRTGLALMATGILAATVALSGARWFDLFWSSLGVLGGAGLTFRIFPSGSSAGSPVVPPGVRPPISSRREGL